MLVVPTIETDRLILRDWTDDDLEAYVAMNADPRVTEFFAKEFTREQSLAGARQIREQLAERGYGWWAVDICDGASFAGLIALQAVPFAAPFTPAYEIGWRFAFDHWGRGYATEGARAALRFAFETLRWPEVVAFTAERNLRSRRVMALLRLYLLRATYLLIGLAQGLQTWPAIIHHTRHWDFWHGVGMSFLGALTALSLVGVRYPVKMLPLLIFEFAWKLLWVLAVWLPLWLGHRVDADTADNAFSIFFGVILVPLVLPWGYIWKNYATAPGDRWK